MRPTHNDDAIPEVQYITKFFGNFMEILLKLYFMTLFSDGQKQYSILSTNWETNVSNFWVNIWATFFKVKSKMMM